jgi:hypothetical protein
MRRKGPFHLHTVLSPVPCLHEAHNRIAPGQPLLRYRDTAACLQCIEALRRPRLQLDVHRIEARYRPKFLDFWANVEMGRPDQCWPWRGYFDKNGRGEFAFRRSGVDPSDRAHWPPAKVAFWFSWGDIGSLRVRHTCGSTYCCNPLHLRAVRVPHNPWAHRLDWLDLALSRKTLLEDIANREQAAREECDTPHAQVMLTAGKAQHRRFLSALGGHPSRGL